MDTAADPSHGRSTAPQSDYPRWAVLLGAAVLVGGLLVTLVLPLVLL